MSTMRGSLYTFWEVTTSSGAQRSGALRIASLVLFIGLWELVGVFVRELPTPLETAQTFLSLIHI